MPKSIWAFSNYKKYLATLIQTGPRGQVSRLAEAAGCQRSYLSNVLRSHIHLVPDQIFGLSRYLGLDARETQYFLLLLEKERAGKAAYRRHLEERAEQLRKDNEDLAQRLERTPLQNEADQLTYYSAWYFSAIHILVSIPLFQSVPKISQALALDSATVETTLTQLERMGLVRKTEGRWHFLSGDIHVPKASPLVSLHHNNWRQRAVLHAQSRKDGLHFTMVQAVSKHVASEIRAKALSLIDDISALAGPSESEELVYFGLDEFRIS